MRSWWIPLAAVGGLLLAIIAAGLVGLLLNLNVQRAAEAASYDVELEDYGDDLRVAVLDLRQYHRNLLFYEPTPKRVAEFKQAYDALQQEIDEIEELGVRDPESPQPDEIRRTATEYYEGFRPAIDRGAADPEAFERASDEGLEYIAEIDDSAERIDELAETRTEDELGLVDRASSRAVGLLVVAVGGLLLSGAALAYLTLRVVSELRRLYAEQRDAAQARTDFLADVSHELRTPLTVLRGNAELGLVLDKEWNHRDLLEEIVTESSRMTGLVEDLLFLARSDSQVVPMETRAVWATELLEEVASRAQVLARERGATLSVDLQGEGVIRVDPRRIEQAIMVLVDNAFKYGTRRGEEREPVQLVSTNEGNELRVSVSDRGPGIEEAELDRIFERFYRLDKARSRKLGGTGLGLPIAKTIVEAHDGRIEAESRVGEGTTMSVRLPLVTRNMRSVTPPASGGEAAVPRQPEVRSQQ
jgi:signal transduction histidine kinase